MSKNTKAPKPKPNPNYPSKTGKPSGPKRGNTPKPKKTNYQIILLPFGSGTIFKN